MKLIVAKESKDFVSYNHLLLNSVITLHTYKKLLAMRSYLEKLFLCDIRVCWIVIWFRYSWEWNGYSLNFYC